MSLATGTINIRWDGFEFAEDADRRFRRTLLVVAVPFLLLGVLSSLTRTEGLKEGGGTYLAPATVELLTVPDAVKAEEVEEPAPAEEDSKEQPQESAPKVAEKPVDVKKPAVVEPTPTPVETARDVAKRSGVLAFADQLSDLRNKGDAISNDSISPNVLSSKGAASNSGSASGGGGESAALAAAASGSSGIGGSGTAGVSRTQSGQGLGKRRATTIDSPVGFGRDASKAGDGGSKGKSGRSLDEIQITFDRAQGSFYAMYIRALRENPGLSGKVVLSVTISSSGKVTDASIVSSELGDPELERKILSRVMLLDFGPKDVPSFTYPNYPIRFQPPN
ncbi:MAG: TonB family protein [Pseudomonadota bacterium]